LAGVNDMQALFRKVQARIRIMRKRLPIISLREVVSFRARM
jgi:hypothetical protein